MKPAIALTMLLLSPVVPYSAPAVHAQTAAGGGADSENPSDAEITCALPIIDAETIRDCTYVIENKVWTGIDVAEAFMNRGVAHNGQRRSRAAVADLTRALEIDPDWGLIVYAERARAHAYLGEHDRAAEDYDRALEVGLPKFRAGLQYEVAAWSCAVGNAERSAALFESAMTDTISGMNHRVIISGLQGMMAKEYQYDGPVDGKFGPEFASGLRRWIATGCVEFVREQFGQDIPGLPSRTTNRRVPLKLLGLDISELLSP